MDNMSRIRDNTQRLAGVLLRYAADPVSVKRVAAALNYHPQQLQEDMESVYQCQCLDTITEQWSNAACMGYAIEAMESIGLTEEQIQTIVDKMLVLMDFKTLEEAAKIYNRSPY